MRTNSVKKYESEKIIITYVAPSERKSIDTTKLKAEQPDIYEAYLKLSPIKESIKIKIK